MNRRSKSTLFLMEQLVVIVVFAVCAAACAKILTHSYLISKEAKDLSNALLAAENGAESYKATGGNISLTANLLGGTQHNIDGKETALIYYNNANRVCAEADSSYVLRITSSAPDDDVSSFASAMLEVEKITGVELISFIVTAREVDR